MTMKKMNLKWVLVCLGLLFTVNAQAQLGNLLKNVLGGGNASTGQTETTTENKVGGLVSLFQNLIGKDKVDNSSLKGEWVYESPAVAFESSNLLNKAGGKFIANTLENTLQKYLDKIGFSEGKVEMAFDGDSTFQMKIGSQTIDGIYSVNENELSLKRKAVLLNARPVTANIAVKTDNIQLTFKADKLLEFFTNISSMTSNNTLNMVSKLASGYDGMQLGFQFKKKE